MKRRDDVPAFWAKVAKGEPDACWLWTGQKSRVGYGVAYGFGSTRNVPIGAHRAAWIITNGPVPEGMNVLHACDVRACCNPAHLHLGTQRQNMREMVERGRAATGDGRRLSVDERETLRKDYLGGMGIMALVRKYGCSPQTVYRWLGPLRTTALT